VAKVNPWALRPVARAFETKTFTDPNAPGEELTLTLISGYDLGREFKVKQLSYDLIRRFVRGQKDEERGETITEPIEPVIGPDGAVTPEVNALACQSYARLVCQQAEGEEAYGFKELAGLSCTMPDALADAVAWSESISANKSAAELSLKKT